MPFTGSHTAAVLPFVRWGMPASALVIGSWSPDLPYYLPVSASGSHTLLGLVTKDLLLGLATFVGWQLFVGRAVVDLAPPPVRRRLVGRPYGLRRTLGSPARLAAAVAALILGGFTHLAWDLFTHSHGWVFEHSPWLRTDHGPLPGYGWVHWFSEVGATAVLASWAVRWWRDQPAPAATPEAPHPALSVAAAGLVVGAAITGLARDINGGSFVVITGSISWAGAALVGVTALWTLRKWAVRPRGPA